MTIRLPLTGALALLLCVLSLPAAAQNDGGLFGNIFKPPAAAPEHGGGAAETELVSRMDRLEATIRQLTGQVEQLQFRNQQLEEKVRRLEEGGAVAAPAGARAPVAPQPAVGPAGRPPATPSGNKRSDAFDPGADPAAPGAPQPLGSPASASVAPPRPAVDGTAGRAGLSAPPGALPAGSQAAPQFGQQMAALPSGGGSARDLYEAGQMQLQRQDYAGAEQTFRQLLQAHASDRLVPDATFMVGETLFLRQNYKDAADFFLDVTTKFPNSTRAPEALLRVGQSLAVLGEKETACVTFQQVDRKYPRAPSAIRQAVEQEIKRVGC